MSKEELTSKIEETTDNLYNGVCAINEAMTHLAEIPAIYAKLWENRIQL